MMETYNWPEITYKQKSFIITPNLIDKIDGGSPFAIPYYRNIFVYLFFALI